MKQRTSQTIVGAAQKLFGARGYDGTSIEAIATEAHVTKATVYRHFENKEALFSAALRGLFDEVPEPASAITERNDTLRARLTTVARNLLALSTGSLMLRLHRMLSLLEESAAAIAEQLWEARIQPYHEAVQRLLREEQETGTLEITDTRVATTHFLSLVASEPMIRLFFTGKAFRDKDDGEKHVLAAVDVFLRAYDSGRTPR